MALPSNSLVTEENLFGQFTVKHLVRIPEAPGYGILSKRFSVQQRHDDNLAKKEDERKLRHALAVQKKRVPLSVQRERRLRPRARRL